MIDNLDSSIEAVGTSRGIEAEASSFSKALEYERVWIFWPLHLDAAPCEDSQCEPLNRPRFPAGFLPVWVYSKPMLNPDPNPELDGTEADFRSLLDFACVTTVQPSEPASPAPPGKPAPVSDLEASETSGA